MNLSGFISGIVLGVSIAAPVGAMGLLCINRTLQRGPVASLSTGAAIATGDTIYGAVAAFGFSVLTELLIAFARPLRLTGAPS